MNSSTCGPAAGLYVFGQALAGSVMSDCTTLHIKEREGTNIGRSDDIITAKPRWLSTNNAKHHQIGCTASNRPDPSNRAATQENRAAKLMEFSVLYEKRELRKYT